MRSHCGLGAGEHEGAVDGVAFKHDEGKAAGCGADADEFVGEVVGDVDGFDEDGFAFLTSQE